MSFPVNFSHANQNNTLSDLENNITSVSNQAWSKSQIKNNTLNVGSIKLIYGPNTKNDWNEGLEAIYNVSKLFDKFEQPKSTYIYFYNISDVAWADENISNLLNDSEERNFKQNNGGEIARSICPKLCTSASQFTPYNPGQKITDRKSIILMGTDVNIVNKYGKKALFAHEYFHSLMRIAQHEPKDQLDIYGEWPPLWFTEGTASFMENVSQNANSYEDYLEYRKIHYNRSISKELDKAFFDNFLDESNLKSGWQKWNHEGMYEVGMRLTEILVASGGLESIMNVYLYMGSGDTFLEAFNKVYGIQWIEAKVSLSKILINKYSPIKENILTEVTSIAVIPAQTKVELPRKVISKKKVVRDRSFRFL